MVERRKVTPEAGSLGSSEEEGASDQGAVHVWRKYSCAEIC